MGGIISTNTTNRTTITTTINNITEINLTNNDIKVCSYNWSIILNNNNYNNNNNDINNYENNSENSKNIIEYSFNSSNIMNSNSNSNSNILTFTNKIEYQIFFSLLSCGINDGIRSNIISKINNIIFFIVYMIKIIELSFIQLKYYDYFIVELKNNIVQIIEKTNSKFEHFNYFFVILERTLKQLLLSEYTENVHESWSKLISSLNYYIEPICLNFKYETEIPISSEDIEEKPNERFLTSFSNVVNL